MRVVVVGATGNVGTSVLRALGDDPQVDEIVGLARRLPSLRFPKVEWRQADISTSELRAHFEGADVVVHLAWLIQPSRDLATLRATNVDGSRRVFRAVAAARVPSLVYASSIGAYSPGPKDSRVPETWPTQGIPTSFYSRHKAETERMLDDFEDEVPEVRVVRLRPGLIFKRESASGQRRLFAGPFLPGVLIRRNLVPAIPSAPRLVFQCVHSHDVAEAYRLAIVGDARGAFNVAAEPVIDPPILADLLHARPLPVAERVVRAAAAASWRMRLQPTPEGWVDLAFESPVMDTTRATTELGWRPQRSAIDALRDLLDGLATGAGFPTPPLEAGGKGPGRLKELLTGVGAR